MSQSMARVGRFVLTSMALAALVACGGGGSGGSGSGGATSVTLSGVAATGAAFTSGTITVIDSRGVKVGASTTLESGNFSVTLDAGAVAPFVLIADRTNADGVTESLVSVAASASVTTVNITPVTHLIAARLSPTGDPLALATQLQASASVITADKVAATVSDVNALLAPALAATGTSSTVDPISATITTNGTGYDRLLDTLNIVITPSGATSNIEVGFKVAQATADAQPPVIQLSSNAAVSTVAAQVTAAAGAVTTATVVPSGTSALITGFLADLTSCFALPLTVRVDTATSNTVAATGTAANVTAQACKNVFFGSDPSQFLSNGARVGRDTENNGAFAGLFRPGATGVVFSQGTYEFTRANGDIVIGYKNRDTGGAETYDTFVVRKDTDGKLKLIGNQYSYPGGVVAYHQARKFVTNDFVTSASQTTFAYHSTGYDFKLPNLVDGNGNPIFNRVIVTTPRGNTLTLKPTTGGSNLNLVFGSGTVSGTSFLRIRSAFDDATQASVHPRVNDDSLFFAGTDFTEAEVAAIPQQSVWKFDYYLAGNTTATPDASQSYKTRARALTLAELSTKGLARLTDASLSGLLARSPFRSQIPMPTDGPLTGLAYTVPTGALPPTSVKAFGRFVTVNAGVATNGARFDDAVTVRSTATTATIACAPATAGDMHCGTVAGTFAANTYMNGLHLHARDPQGREYSQFYAFYKLTVPVLP